MSPLTLTIHRAAHEIGGNCIELRLGEHRLLLDAGSPLDAGRSPLATQIPATLDLEAPVDGVVISHPHQDHYGLLPALPERWPVWAGAASAALMDLTWRVTGSTGRPLRSYESFRRFDVGPFRITPLLTDHSAFDAHMLLIEAGGRRVLYSGDFRRTGRKAGLVDRLLQRPPMDVDLLLLEGTTLGRASGFPTETDLEASFLDAFQRTPGRVFVSWSAQNIDRTVTIYRAAKRAGRELVLDVYSLHVLETLARHRDSLPRLGFPGMRGLITRSMARMYRHPERMDEPRFVDQLAETGRCVSAQNLDRVSSPVVMLRPSLFRDLQKAGVQPTGDDLWVFSQWRGYLDQGGYDKVQQAFRDAGAGFAHVHTSGHACRDDLLALANAVNARKLVPIHSFDWDQHLEAFPAVVRLHDGELHEV